MATLAVLDKPDATNHTRAVKLSNKGRYAVRALFDIAFFNGGQPTQVKDIAERQSIPPRFLEQIFQDLKRARIVGSKRGPQGGYSLALPAAEVSVGDVVRALEGPISLGEKEADAAPSEPANGTIRVTEEVFHDLAKRVEACFDAITIQEICDRAEASGLGKPTLQPYVYVI